MLWTSIPALEKNPRGGLDLDIIKLWCELITEWTMNTSLTLFWVVLFTFLEYEFKKNPVWKIWKMILQKNFACHFLLHWTILVILPKHLQICQERSSVHLLPWRMKWTCTIVWWQTCKASSGINRLEPGWKKLLTVTEFESCMKNLQSLAGKNPIRWSYIRLKLQGLFSNSHKN